MNAFDLIAVLVSLAAVFAYFNHRHVGLPTTIGVMAIALVLSLGLLAGSALGLHLAGPARAMLEVVDFDETLMQGMLGYLLFAGALHIDLDELRQQKWIVGFLATAGVVGSTFLVGGATHLLSGALGLGLPLSHCLLFGALISPTDPIAVLAILKTTDTPRSLQIKIAGESLFNDGVGVVVFLVLLGAAGGAEVTLSSALSLLALEAGGGALLGLALGWLAYAMLRRIDGYQIEVLITLALVTGGYALAMALHLSGPIAMVVAGLLMGNQGRSFAMNDETREHLDSFWELVDEILNAVLFLLIGLELLVVRYSAPLLVATAVAIAISLAVRFAMVGLPVLVLRRFREFSPRAVRVMTWGGLRGGISVALALSIPAGPHRDTVLAITYGVVVFSILVQGLTIGRVVGASRFQSAL